MRKISVSAFAVLLFVFAIASLAQSAITTTGDDPIPSSPTGSRGEPTWRSAPQQLNIRLEIVGNGGQVVAAPKASATAKKPAKAKKQNRAAANNDFSVFSWLGSLPGLLQIILLIAVVVALFLIAIGVLRMGGHTSRVAASGEIVARSANEIPAAITTAGNNIVTAVNENGNRLNGFVYALVPKHQREDIGKFG